MGRNWGLGGLFVHGVHAFEEGEEGAQVFFFGGELADGVDELLAAFGTAGIDFGEDLGGVAGNGAQLFVFEALEVAVGVFAFFFDLVAPAAEGAVGDADDGGEVFPGGAGLGGFAEELEVFLVHGGGRWIVVSG